MPYRKYETNIWVRRWIHTHPAHWMGCGNWFVYRRMFEREFG